VASVIEPARDPVGTCAWFAETKKTAKSSVKSKLLAVSRIGFSLIVIGYMERI
jgi:hypothetical protein